MKKLYTTCVLLLAAIISNVMFGQIQSFPANKTNSFGLMPTNRNSTDAATSYSVWKTNFLEACTNGRYRVKFDNARETVSEGIGYGMLLTAYAGDRTIFDGLWNYYKDNRNANGVMNWKIEGCSVRTLGFNGATDGELDVAMGLIIADFQWGNEGAIRYGDEARSLIGIIKTKEVESGTNVLKPGDAFGGSNLTNCSYFAPGYYRKFASFTGDNSWLDIANKSYQIIDLNLSVNNAVGGLVSDWCRADGSHSSDAGAYVNQGKTYLYDAARTPWRIAVDYAWYGNESARLYSKKVSDFVRVTLGGTTNVKDGYNQNGTVIGRYHNATFVGGFGSAAIAGENQTHLNSTYTDLLAVNEPNSYFNHSLRTLYLFLLNGEFYLPNNGATTPNNPPSVSITSPSSGSAFISGSNITISANANDVDGSISKVEFYNGSTKLGEDLTSPYQFTIAGAAAGSYSLTARAIDNLGSTSTSSLVSISVSGTGGTSSCSFGAPTSTALGAFNRISFAKLYVYGTSLIDASNFKKFQINWNPTKNSLGQFSYSTVNGIPDFFNDLRPKITQNFNSSNPSVTISGSGITGLDGSYWAVKHNESLALVSKNGVYTLYFSNATTKPACPASSVNSEVQTRNISNSTKYVAYPNPVSNILNIDSEVENSKATIHDLQGRKVLDENMGIGHNAIHLNNIISGIYILTVKSGEEVYRKQIVIEKE